MSCRPSCMLAHDLANKLSAVVSHCDLIELEIDPSSSTYKHSEKIRQLAFQMNDLLHTRTVAMFYPIAEHDSLAGIERKRRERIALVEERIGGRG